MLALLARLVGDLFEQTRSAPAGVGICVPGVVDEATATVRFAANLGWRDVPLGERVASALGVPVTVRHDVRAAARAEGRLGAGRDVADFLFLSLGTGVAAALVLGGRVRAGRHWSAGEIGHLHVAGAESPCACGRSGCLETIASASALTSRYAAGRSPREGGAPASGPHAGEVLRRAGAGDALAARLRDEAVAALGDAIAAAQALVDVDLVVIGGGMALAGEPLFAPLRQAVVRSCGVAVPPEVVAATLGPQAGLIGAGLAAWDSLVDGSAISAPARTGGGR